MSAAAIFDEDSSDDEEFDDNKNEEKDDTPKRTIKMDEDEDEDDDDSDDDGDDDDAAGARDSSDAAPKKEETKKESTAAALFGDDSDDDDDDDSDNAKQVDKAKDSGSKDKDEEEKKKDAKEAPKSKPTTSDLFGDSSDDDDEGEAKLDDVVGSSAPAGAKKTEVAPSQDEDAPVPSSAEAGSAVVVKPPEKAMVLESNQPGKDVSLHMTKLPNLVAIQPAAFEEDLYLEKEEEEQYKGYVQNMIRWRYKRNSDGELERGEDGSLVRESNSRLVQWSDGSFTLHVGNETFDIQTTDSSSQGFAGLNGYIYLSQKAAFSNEGAEDDAPGGTVLECMAPVTSRFVPKPSSLQSEAHKSLTVAVRQKTIKKARIAEYVTQEDPELAKAARVRNKEDLEKAMARKSTSSYRPSGGSRSRPSSSRRYMDEEDDDGDYDTTNIKALKRNGMEDDMDDYGDESDDDGYDDTFRKGRDRKRRKKEDEEDEDDEEELVFEEESDEEEGTLIKAHKKTNRSRQAVVDDDDED